LVGINISDTKASSAFISRASQNSTRSNYRWYMMSETFLEERTTF